MVRWSEPVRMVLGNIRESPTNQNRARDFSRTPVPCLGARWPPLCPGVCPRFDPQTQGGLASGLEGLVPRGAAPVPPVPLGTE